MKSSPITVLQVLANKYRNTDHQVEHDLRAVIKQFLDSKNSNTKTQESLQMLRDSKKKLMNLKRELSQSCKQQIKLYQVMKKRLHTAKDIQDPGANCQLHNEIIQHLLNKGYIDKARQLQKALGQEAQTMFGVQTQLFQQANSICQEIKKNNLLGVRIWADENAHMLEKTDSFLEFELLCCEYINLIRMGQYLAACMALRQGISSMKLNTTHQSIVSKLTFALASPKALPSISDHLERLLKEFKKSFTEFYAVSFDQTFSRYLSLGFSALKSVCCSCQQKRNPDICPLCVELSTKITSRIPMLTAETSSLKCRVNGSIMDEQNYPLALPSNHIYSLSGLAQTQKNGSYYCKMTETWYFKQQAKRVYFA